MKGLVITELQLSISNIGATKAQWILIDDIHHSHSLLPVWMFLLFECEITELVHHTNNCIFKDYHLRSIFLFVLYLGGVASRIFKVILKKQNTEVVLAQEQSSVKKICE